MAAAKKPRGDELYTAVLTFFGASGAFVEAGSEWRGDHPVVLLHPQHFALSSGGQLAIDAASRALLEDIHAAQRERELRWYGPPPELRWSAPPGRPDIGIRMYPDIVALGWKSGRHRCHDGDAARDAVGGRNRWPTVSRRPGST